MGKTKKGEGGGRSPTTEQVARSLLRQYSSEGTEVASIKIARLTEGLYSCEVLEHGQQDAEAFFLSLDDAS